MRCGSMFERQPYGVNDPYAAVDNAADMILDVAAAALREGEADRIADQTVVKLMTAAVKLYADKAAARSDPFRPITGTYDETVTATEVLTTAIELLRALNLGPMELGLWSQRKPKEYCYQPGPEVAGDGHPAEEGKQNG